MTEETGKGDGKRLHKISGRYKILSRLYPANLEPAQGVALFCCDLIFDRAHRLFLRKNGFERFVPISIPGGGSFLAQPTSSPEQQTMEEYLQLLVEELGVKRMVFIGHSGCRWYRYNFPGETDYEIKITDDLRAIAAHVRKEFPGLTVDGTFYADRHEHRIRMIEVL
jgi:hypothetical protein